MQVKEYGCRADQAKGKARKEEWGRGEGMRGEEEISCSSPHALSPNLTW